MFLENNDYIFMLGLLKEIAQNYSLNIYAFCLMPNHLHLLLSPKEKNLYDAMRDLFSRYAMKFNRKYERKGHLPARHRFNLLFSFIHKHEALQSASI